jgi:signal peptidase I
MKPPFPPGRRPRYLVTGTILAIIGACLLWPVACHGETPPVIATCGPTQSMFPVIRGGELLIIAPTPFRELKKGDIVLRRVDWYPTLVCHRITKVGFGRAITKGDNNPTEDSGWMTPATYAGRVLRILPPPVLPLP